MPSLEATVLPLAGHSAPFYKRLLRLQHTLKMLETRQPKGGSKETALKAESVETAICRVCNDHCHHLLDCSPQ